MAEVKVAFLGDIMPGGVLNGTNNFIDDEVSDYLNTFDLRVGTLECPFGNNIEYDSKKMSQRQNVIYAKNDDIQKLIHLHLDVVSIANNHIMDLGVDGLKNTIRLLKSRNIDFCGAGMNISEASKPTIVTSHGKKIAFLGYCYTGRDIPNEHIADVDRPGISPLHKDKILSDIRKARAKSDHIFVILHWGNEYRGYPTDQQRKEALAIMNSGADGIIGSHSHQIQPLVNYNDKPVFFSLGNFLFPDFYVKPPRPLFYPEESLKQELPVIHTYPFPIEQKAKRVWRELARIGMIGEVLLDKKVSAKYRLTRLTEENKVKFCSTNVMKTPLYITKIALKTPFYKYSLTARKLYGRIRNLL